MTSAHLPVHCTMPPASRANPSKGLLQNWIFELFVELQLGLGHQRENDVVQDALHLLLLGLSLRLLGFSRFVGFPQLQLRRLLGMHSNVLSWNMYLTVKRHWRIYGGVGLRKRLQSPFVSLCCTVACGTSRCSFLSLRAE